MEYTFEKMFDGRYQVRLGGEFVCYTVTTDPDYVDEKLFKFGYYSREEFFQDSLSTHLAAIGGSYDYFNQVISGLY